MYEKIVLKFMRQIALIFVIAIVFAVIKVFLCMILLVTK